MEEVLARMRAKIPHMMETDWQDLEISSRISKECGGGVVWQLDARQGGPIRPEGSQQE